MDLAHAFVAQRLASRTADRRYSTTDAEVRSVAERVLARRRAAASIAGHDGGRGILRVGSGGREYPERGRHAAPRPARA
jgi:hypothetical protein